MDPELYELLQEGDPADEVAVVLRLLDPARPPEGTRVVAHFGHVVTARVQRGTIPEVWRDPAVESMKAPKGVSPDLVRPADLTEALPLTPNDERRAGDLGATGRGVVIGLIDWGCDFAHPDFRHADGTTRLLALWDQRRGGDTDAWPYGYGRLYDAARLNAALKAPDPYAALGYHPADADPGLGAHGTHTLGIAGGNGRGGGPPGVAPEAELVFVHMGAREGPDAVPLGNSVELLEGLDLIARVAAGRPCVVNMSLGRHAGEKTGHSLVERALDEWVALAPGRAIVQSCGNYYERRTHADWTLRPGETRTFVVQVSPQDRTPNELDLWYPGRDRLGVEVRSADGRLAARAALGERAAAQQGGREVLRVYHRAFDPNNGDHQISVRCEVVPDVHAWHVILTGQDVQDGRVHAWIERDSACGSCQSRFPRDEADARYTLGTICTGYRTLAVGAYDPHREDRPLGHFSSSGPTRDGRPKPDLIAPGVMILAPRSHGRDGGETRLYTRMSGTSMAAPHVTGTVALMFEAAGPLDIARTRRLLLASCEPAAPELDFARVGSGYLDPGRAVQAARTGQVPSLPLPAAQEVSLMHEASQPAADLLREHVHPVHSPGLADVEATAESEEGFVSDVDAELTALEFAGSSDGEESLPEAEEGFTSDVDGELTAFEFASASEEESKGTGDESEPAIPPPPDARPAGLRFLERFEAGLGTGRPPSAAEVLLEAARGEEADLWTELARGALRPHEVWAAFRGDGFPAVRAALEPRLMLVAAPGGTLSGLLPGDLLVQRAPGSPFTAVSVVRGPGDASAPVWRAAAGELRGTHQRVLDDAGRVAAHTVVLRPRLGETLAPDLAEVAGPCADVTVAPADRPRLLIRGSVHPAVREVQRKLNAFHFAQILRGQPGLPGVPLTEDCVFGAHTQAAVLEFQRQVFPGLTAEHDGKVGAHTWAQLDAVVLDPASGAAAVTVEPLALMDDTFTRALAWDDVIGLDAARLNVRLRASGLPAAVLPGELPVFVVSRPPNGDSGTATLTGRSLNAARSGRAPSGGQEYRLSVALADLGDFLAVETRRKEVATVVRIGGTSDADFRTALGWTPRGRSTQPGTPGAGTGDAASERPDARKLFLAGGLEVLEARVLPQPGLRVPPDARKALARNPADVFYYSGHGLGASNCLAVETSPHSYGCWLTPADLAPHWKSPMDLDVLILAGCSVLRVDLSGPSGPGVEWAELLRTKGGPLTALLGYEASAPLDHPNGEAIARDMGARLAAGSRNFARDWMEVNAAHKAWNAVALDTRGYWDFDCYRGLHTCNLGDLRGPRPLP
ncbi:hypothetical protein E5F05_06105 [Deinococcus metallilatus]|uniref:Subtilisin family serine protease/peptidoglycan hydrolase-like protein with peptidoglycan-binding domain n=2 Tax=Deinococcus metallilatus TaxID=1211322 RepID=A0AAJ5FA67_9DEIO|nr:S8 family serine peptidase [Deinococcus metallilatus]MBB5294513.1 subtilisin family serine protease/peptidoglycan hydrolase-like protein with peptidoglycan-binding domain [Deinococcus metallilatus]QBY07562.1 hypothetical protein E5F05_06105 [Deinococcus metallilatus]TLK29943.1 hypothetical protein FCS05_05255 [Deinococcus metallilatus]GMA15728.1 hypothetical protein GCM10025871_20590 [Deinococcus metallilatus]